MTFMKNIVLIGFMGTGKTSAGKLLASRLGYTFIDTDQCIEKENKMTINDMFLNYGESYFREKESELAEKVAQMHHVVISTGGGIILNADNMKYFQQTGTIIALTADVDVILERTSRRNERPLLERENRRQIIMDLLNTRKNLYNKGQFVVDTSHLSPLQVTDEILKYLRKDGK